MNKSPDFNDFKAKGSREAKEHEAALAKGKLVTGASRWWLASDAMLPAMVMAQVASIIQADRGRIDSYNTYAKLYGTYVPSFWNGYQLSNSGRPIAPMRDRLTYNIIQSCVDTLTSMVQANKPKPMFLTSAGDSRVQQRAKKLDAFCYGVYYENDVYGSLAPGGFRDGCVFGEGIIHAYADQGKIKYERVLPYELLTDYMESHYGPRSTRSLHRIKNIDRTELAEMFPKHAKVIAGMTGTSQFVASTNRSVGDTVTVVESWRLPVGTQKGQHSIVVENAPPLLREEYTEDFFPFAIFRYNPRLYGFYSQGMAEQLLPIQIELNRTLISIQRSLYMGGTHKIFVKAGSKVIKSHFDNAIGTIMEYAGDTAPQYVVPQLVQPEIYAHLESIKAMGYNLPGISQMGATSVKTPGVNSGKAMRTEQNINTQRHQTVEQAYNQFVAVELAKITVATARKAYQDKQLTKKVKVPGKRFIQTIDWKDVSLEDDQFVLQIYPVSKLPQDPEGRLASIQEMMQAGMISLAAGKRLMDFPDLDAEENLSNASRDYLHKLLDDIIDHGKYKGPEPDDDLKTAKELVLEYIAWAKLNNLEEKRLQLLRTFNDQIGFLVNLAKPPIPVQGTAPGSPPIAVPENPPVSNLLPNAPIAS